MFQNMLVIEAPAVGFPMAPVLRGELERQILLGVWVVNPSLRADVQEPGNERGNERPRISGSWNLFGVPGCDEDSCCYDSHVS